jgi:hypothetical protein
MRLAIVRYRGGPSLLLSLSLSGVRRLPSTLAAVPARWACSRQMSAFAPGLPVRGCRYQRFPRTPRGSRSAAPSRWAPIRAA